MKRKQKQLKTELYNTILHNEFKRTYVWIKKKVNGIQRTVRQRHSRKLSRNKIDLHSKKNSSSQRKWTRPKCNKSNLFKFNIVPKSLLAKGPSFFPTPVDRNWYELRKDFTNFVNQLRYKVKQFQSTSIEPSESNNNNINNSFSSPPVQHARYTPLYRAKETNIKSLELFIENIEKDIFDTAAVRNVRPNISKGEKEALKEMKSWNNQTVRVQDKGSCFVILDNNDYEQKIQTQIDRSSFNRLEEDPSKKFDIEINNWVLKWHRKKVLDDKWKSYITPHNSRPGKIYATSKRIKQIISQE